MRSTHRLPLVFVLTLFLGFECPPPPGPGGVEFDLGVGAFEIGPREAIVWARVVPEEAGQKYVPVTVEVARDDAFTELVQIRNGAASVGEDYTVRVRVAGLDPATAYHYRFVHGTLGFGGQASPVGRFRTAPKPHMNDPIKFVVSGDSNVGYVRPRGLDFYVLSAAAAEEPDFFVYFGDTIYADSGVLPGGADAHTLDEYREVHKLTRADPHLQTLLAATGTFTGWDDHEIRNDYAGQTVDPAQFENGARAFFEYLPVRPVVGDAPWRTDRTVRWGQHVELFFLDGRQFRSAEFFCNPDPIPDGPETGATLFSPFVDDEVIAEPILGGLFPLAADLFTPSDPACTSGLLAAPGRDYLGAAQMAELQQALLDSTATFKVIVNNTPLSELFFLPYDRWEGYGAERQGFLDFLEANFDADELLVLTTDFHTNLALKRAEFTELIVGPIGQGTFGRTVLSRLPPELGFLADSVFALLDLLLDEANGPGSVVGSEADAFSYAVVEVFEDDAGVPHLRVTVRGDTDYLSGDNDPAKVVDLFSFEMP